MLRAKHGRWFTRDGNDPVDHLPDTSPAISGSVSKFHQRDKVTLELVEEDYGSYIDGGTPDGVYTDAAYDGGTPYAFYATVTDGGTPGTMYTNHSQ
mgnify:CR=1 FL=1